MKLINYFLILTIVFGCKNKDSSIPHEVVLKNPTVVPVDLNFKSRTLNTYLNTALFDTTMLDKNNTATSKEYLATTDFTYESDFVSYLNKTIVDPQETYGGNTPMDIYLSFECDACKNAYFLRTIGNHENITSEVKMALSGPRAHDFEIPKNNNTYEYRSGRSTLDLNGDVGFYLALQDVDHELFIYEIAGVNSDASAPVFKMSEGCDDTTVNKPFEGLVCFDSMYFQGDDVSGYSVPLKGNIYGDVTIIKINGMAIDFVPGEFFKRIRMDLFTGYNQIPVELSDRFGNTTAYYLEIELEEVKPEAKE